MSSAYWQTKRREEHFDCGNNLRSRIRAYTRTWQNRCYSNGIPDEVPKKLSAVNRVPSWRAVALAILKYDNNLYSLGFAVRENEAVTKLYENNKIKTEEFEQLSLFDRERKNESFMAASD